MLNVFCNPEFRLSQNFFWNKVFGLYFFINLNYYTYFQIRFLKEIKEGFGDEKEEKYKIKYSFNIFYSA